jgi:hypothetical protein
MDRLHHGQFLTFSSREKEGFIMIEIPGFEEWKVKNGRWIKAWVGTACT